MGVIIATWVFVGVLGLVLALLARSKQKSQGFIEPWD